MSKLSELCLLLAALCRAVAADKVTRAYFTDGGELTFNVSRPSSDPISNILWKFKGDMMAEWVKNKIPVEVYSPFSGRADMDTVSARLVVRNMTKADTGTYTLGIDDKVHGESYDAVWIRNLSKPTVTLRTLTCVVGMESCLVSCVTDTAEAEPIAFGWKFGEKEWKGSEKDSINITTLNNVLDETITCQISNPVSKQVSKAIKNPLYYYNSVLKIVAVVIGLLFVCVAACVFFMVKFKKGFCKAQNPNKLSPSINTPDPTAVKVEPTAVKVELTDVNHAPTPSVPHGDPSNTRSEEDGLLSEDSQDNKETVTS
ncbi:lymphocyte function-associated antigen 3-like [Clinocottus analis]|uniref:lymphocyte function-associated antigen 3-like n=1 Tax=Clinocottus analis TaxID=304258 RepID=UPI0035C0E86C